MKNIKTIIESGIESIRATGRQKRQRKELKTRLMADRVEDTPIPNIYKVEFISKSGEGYDKYNLYDAKENFYLFNQCKTTLKHLKYGLYFVRDHEKPTEDCGAGIFDATTNWFVYAKRPSLIIRQLPDKKTDAVLLQSNNELIVFNLKTKSVERVIGI